MKSNPYAANPRAANPFVSLDVACPVKLFALTQPDPRVDSLLSLVRGKTPRQIVELTQRRLITLDKLERIRQDLNHNRPHTNINRLISASVGHAISIIKGEE
ncbi:hypothetical protein ACN2AS_10995 [Serratia liquefaciens]|uniref:hypothetical protein n=1 Tax=Serratia liquefaciens TaxID=614 RepID=UPI0011F0C6ED|nr:hypothetical protein [Serratia liquefaciens]QIC86924.1 hypothetical protein F0336_10985 [Serratia liquefaciens]